MPDRTTTPRSFRLTLLFWSGLCLLAAVLLLSAAYAVMLGRALRSLERDAAVLIAQRGALSFPEAGEPGLQAALDAASAGQPGTGWVVLDPDGNTLAGNGAPLHLPAAPPSEGVLPVEGGLLVTVRLTDGRSLEVFVPAVQGSRQMLLRLGLPALVILLAGLTALWWALWRATLPLDAIRVSLENLAAGRTDEHYSAALRSLAAARRDNLGGMARSLAETESYLSSLSAAAREISEGRLDSALQPRCAQDELGTSFSKMADHTRSAILRFASSASEFKRSSAQMNAAASQLGIAVRQISTTLQEISKGSAQQSQSIAITASSVESMTRAIHGVANGAQSQAEAVNKAADVATRINNIIQRVSNNARTVLQFSSNAAEAARSGTARVEETIASMETIRQRVGVSSEKMHEMSQRSERIGTIVETIETISEQTNLLAINAAIEAARARQFGKGFAVVADEVRRLADRAASSTKEIADLVGGIQAGVAEAVLALQEGAGEVERGVLLANSSGQSLQEILQSVETAYQRATGTSAATVEMNKAASDLMNVVETVSSVVEENTAATATMAVNSSDVSQAVENIASVSEENSASMEEVSASTEEMSILAEQVAASAAALEELAQRLENMASEFYL